MSWNYWKTKLFKHYLLVWLLIGVILAACQADMVQPPARSNLLTVIPTLDIPLSNTPNSAATALFDLFGEPTATNHPTATAVGTLVSYFLPQMPEGLESVEIHLSRNDRFESCPKYTVTIYGDGRVVYSGKQYIRVKGEREYIIPKENVQTLVDLFYEYGFFSWQDEYPLAALDNPTYTISIKIEAYRKTVYVYAPYTGPDMFLMLADEIDELSGVNDLLAGN